MAHAVEGRTPLLDSGVAAAAFRLPDALKVKGHSGKWLLRQWLADNFPAAEPFRPKQGFTVPVGAWIENAAERLAPLVAAQPGVAALVKPDRVLPLFRHASEKRAGFAAWHLLFYALWHRRHIEGRRDQGDVFEVLAAR
jgi:asparagine synthase (glutamine-hydrolysing)